MPQVWEFLGSIAAAAVHSAFFLDISLCHLSHIVHPA